ncbi:hypothetical protein SGFS_037780 [Streptomyces graminofaciens]|uniref:Uncharacterized protein n=1 Tax=Streptomyces graminofaciens TaxID=68212 RepID=A0ABN5VH08_9ACTN|nr:hypothetical protein SGFS_037780 [Streptomyces graminofaciens]
MSIDESLERVRADLDRMEPKEAHDAAQAGEALLVDIRYAALRDRDGLVPGTLVVERNELEWRLDPQGSHRVPEDTVSSKPPTTTCASSSSATRATPPASRPPPCANWARTGRPT